MLSLEDDMAQSMERALIFGAFLDSLCAPTPAQLWLERAAAQLRHERDPDGSKRANRATTIAKLLQRDGHDCWFCDRQLGSDITIEHLQPLALGGKWNDENLALAHQRCNKAAGHLSRGEKEKLREDYHNETIALASADRSPEGQDNADWPDRNDESAVAATGGETPIPKQPKHFRSGGGNASSGNPPPSNHGE